MGRKRLFTIGKVTGIHGLKGYLKVRSFVESISVFRKGIKLNAKFPGKKEGTWHEILNASPYKKGVRLLFKDVDINNADDFIGKELLAPREYFYDYKSGTGAETGADLNYQLNSDMESGDESRCCTDSEYGLEKDTYFWEDLKGISVIDLKKGFLGKISYVMATGSNDVFVVTGGKREVLVPGLKSVVLSVDIDKNEMKIDLPEGL